MTVRPRLRHLSLSRERGLHRRPEDDGIFRVAHECILNSSWLATSLACPLTELQHVNRVTLVSSRSMNAKAASMT